MDSPNYRAVIAANCISAVISIGSRVTALRKIEIRLNRLPDLIFFIDILPVLKDGEDVKLMLSVIFPIILHSKRNLSLDMCRYISVLAQ